MSNKYSWKEGYNHARETYVPLWNSAMNFVAETYGEEALDKYLDQYMSKVRHAYFPLKKEDVEREGVKAYLKYLVPHMEKLGFEIRVEKAEPDESIVNVLKCGSKNLLKEKNLDSKYYCRHCGVGRGLHRKSPLGFISSVEKTGEDSCIRTFKIKKI